MIAFGILGSVMPISLYQLAGNLACGHYGVVFCAKFYLVQCTLSSRLGNILQIDCLDYLRFSYPPPFTDQGEIWHDRVAQYHAV